LVLPGHGCGRHKKVPGLMARVPRYVTTCGFAVAAIDAPGHGYRPTTEQDERFTPGTPGTPGTPHAGPGRHAGIPAFESESSRRFFTRHLT
jgi:hypothetical protein